MCNRLTYKELCGVFLAHEVLFISDFITNSSLLANLVKKSSGKGFAY